MRNIPYLFQYVIRTTSRSAWAFLSVPAARRAPWCTSSSGSPHAGSSPPPPYQYDSPDIHTHKAPLNHQNQSHTITVQYVLLFDRNKIEFILSSHNKTLGTNVGKTNTPHTHCPTWWIAPNISERLDTLIMDWMRISRFFWSLWMISMDWLSSSHRGVRAWENRREKEGMERVGERHKERERPREKTNDCTWRGHSSTSFTFTCQFFHFIDVYTTAKLQNKIYDPFPFTTLWHLQALSPFIYNKYYEINFKLFVSVCRIQHSVHQQVFSTLILATHLLHLLTLNSSLCDGRLKHVQIQVSPREAKPFTTVQIVIL